MLPVLPIHICTYVFIIHPRRRSELKYLRYEQRFNYFHLILHLGLVTLSEWCVALEQGTELKLPWRLLRTRIAEMDPHGGLVKYATTFADDTATGEVCPKLKIIYPYKCI